MMQRVLTALVAASFLAYAAPAQAQRGRYRDSRTPVEFGVDAAATFTMGTPNFTVISVPAAQVRIGVFASPNWEFEPNFGLLSASGGGDRLTQVQLGLGVLYLFAPSRFDTQPYLRPFAAVQSVSSSGESTTTSPSVGIGFGAKFPIGARFAFRPELNYAHVFTDGDADDADQIQVLAGFSVYGR